MATIRGKLPFHPVLNPNSETRQNQIASPLAVNAGNRKSKRPKPTPVTFIGLGGRKRVMHFRVPDYSKVEPNRRRQQQLQAAVWWDSVRGLGVSEVERAGAADPESAEVYRGFEKAASSIPWPTMKSGPSAELLWGAFGEGTKRPETRRPDSYVEQVLGSETFFLPVPVVREGKEFSIVNPYWLNEARGSHVTEYFTAFNQAANEALAQMLDGWKRIETEEDFLKWANGSSNARTSKATGRGLIRVPHSFWLAPVQAPNGQIMPRFVAAQWQFKYSGHKNQWGRFANTFLSPSMDDMINTFLTEKLPPGLVRANEERRKSRETLLAPWKTEMDKIGSGRQPSFTASGFINKVGRLMDQGRMPATTWSDLEKLKGGSRALTMLGVRYQLQEMPEQMGLVYSGRDQHGNKHPSVEGIRTLLSIQGGEEALRAMTMYDKQLEEMASSFIDTAPARVIADGGLMVRELVGLPVSLNSVITRSPELLPGFPPDIQQRVAANKQDALIASMPLMAGGMRALESVLQKKFGGPTPRRADPREDFAAPGERPSDIARAKPFMTKEGSIGLFRGERERAVEVFDSSTEAGHQARLLAADFGEEPLSPMDKAMLGSMQETFDGNFKELGLIPDVEFNDRRSYRSINEYLGDVIKDTPRIRAQHLRNVRAAAEARFNLENASILQEMPERERVHFRQQYIRGVLARAPEPNILEVAMRKIKGLGPAQWTQGASGIINFGSQMGWWDRRTAQKVNEMMLSQRTIDLGSQVAIGTLQSFAIVAKNQEFLKRRDAYLKDETNFGKNRVTSYAGQAFSLGAGFAAAEGEEDLAAGLGAIGGIAQGYAALRPFGQGFGIGGAALLGTLGLFGNRARARGRREFEEKRDREAAERAARRAAFEAERARIQELREADFSARSLRSESRSLAIRIARGATRPTDAQNLSRFFRRPQFASSLGLVGDVERRASRQFRPRF